MTQTLSLEALLALVPQHDGWIIGDDPANRQVLAAGAAGRLKAAVQGEEADRHRRRRLTYRDLGIRVTNTPGMFGAELADVALGYVIALARETFLIDRGVREGGWPKPRGISLAGCCAALIGYGDIGPATCIRACGLRVIVYDPTSATPESDCVSNAVWPERCAEADFVVVTCALTSSSRHMVDARAFAAMRQGVRIVNVSRGPVIDEAALVEALRWATCIPLRSTSSRSSRCRELAAAWLPALRVWVAQWVEHRGRGGQRAGGAAHRISGGQQWPLMWWW